MITIRFADELKNACPEIQLSCIETSVKIASSSDELKTEIKDEADRIASLLKTEDIRHIPTIDASRKAYKACGKDPARYRLSAEALTRRIVNGKGLYEINNVVDLLNLVSIHSGFSIGGYDRNKIQGDVVFGIGQSGEAYTGLGRGALNIEGMPVFRDQQGAFGTPTSDSERTGVRDDTSRFLMIIVAYEPTEELKQATDFAIALLKKYARATDVEHELFTM